MPQNPFKMINSSIEFGEKSHVGRLARWKLAPLAPTIGFASLFWHNCEKSLPWCPLRWSFFRRFFFNFNLELKLWTGSVWALNWVVCVCVAPENRGPAPIEKWVGNTTKIQKFPGSARCDFLFLTASGKESIIFFSGAVKKYFMVPMSTKWVSGRKIRPKGRNKNNAEHALEWECTSCPVLVLYFACFPFPN